MEIVLTSDIDFASEIVLAEAYKNLHSLPMTIFQTNKSNFLTKAFANNKNWEAEIHPNFCAGSSHGNTHAEVISSLDLIESRRLGFRCHRYYSVNDINEEYAQKGYKYSSNICTDLVCVHPFKTRCGLIEFPIFFEDGGYMKYHGEVPSLEEVLSRMNDENGIYVFNFHPIHLALNSNNFQYIRIIKDSLSRVDYQNIGIESIRRWRNSKYGMYDFLEELLNYVDRNNVKLKNLEDVFNEWS